MKYAAIARRHSNPAHIVESLRLDREEPEKRDALLELFYENAAKAIALSVLAQVPEHDRPTLTSALHSRDQKKVYDALRPRIPDLQAFLHECVEQELRETKRRMRG